MLQRIKFTCDVYLRRPSALKIPLGFSIKVALAMVMVYLCVSAELEPHGLDPDKDRKLGGFLGVLPGCRVLRGKSLTKIVSKQKWVCRMRCVQGPGGTPYPARGPWKNVPEFGINFRKHVLNIRKKCKLSQNTDE